MGGGERLGGWGRVIKELHVMKDRIYYPSIPEGSSSVS